MGTSTQHPGRGPGPAGESDDEGAVVGDPERVWTHLSDEQADGSACVMCGRSVGSPGWTGTVIGRSEAGVAVVACAGQGTTMTGDGRGQLVPVSGTGGPTCAQQAEQVVPDAPEF